MFMPPVFPAHWHVSQPVLIADTFSSLVWKVSLPDGTPAIVKGLKPIEDIADELRGADYLVWRNGRGAVRLLGRENNLMLLEYAGERMLSHIVAEHGDYQATEIAAELMAKLYAASEEPLPSALLPIRDRFAALFQRARDDQNAGCQTDYVHAAIIADQMMSNASELRGLHGDLHHENIMFSSRGWLVIDPVGLVGVVGFGAANMFYDPADRDDLCLDPRRIAQMADAFSRALDVDPRRLLDQAYAYGCLSAAWNADGEEEQRDLAIAAAIKQVRQTSY
ncbi:APH(6)-I family aminoglycoside O-phosphotransferase [Acinetobacter baumannii]|uniref:APH(6)-I family aminoglycoside O-phosphotransferase n=1 Tax=Acinetobacter baumannii TaxID=470 RepID=UPI000F740F93|nr:APH(6)-I family aminoglycoside O-phosphotransferase [Acinetobacter baumannii]EDY6095278.1 APH(6)-I family aminoglycoside O-phosphotransferase [Salmonella enterica]RSR24652.1 APH(6)-I family aminoglycoside O-phosphotransferase [Acinetobacter baumannii]